MPRRTSMARFGLAVPLAGSMAAVLSALVLGILAWLHGHVPWAPMNATTHALHGPGAGSFAGFDWSHTGLGTAIHFAGAFFWAAVAVALLHAVRRGSTALAWATGMGVAALALVVDYGLMPARLTPGWELVLPPPAVALGFFAFGVGLSLGLAATRAVSHEIVGPAPGGDAPSSASEDGDR